MPSFTTPFIRTAVTPSGQLGAAVVVFRDRTGFEYQRDVGLDDHVSVREAAQLLQLPVMTINRWVRKGELKSSKRNGFSIVRLSEVLRAAKDRQRPLKLGSRLVVIGLPKIGGQPMRKMLAIGEAAVRLGLEVDTLRRLEREGVIEAERTRGGHRRFAEVEVARLARARSGRRMSAAVPSPCVVQAPQPRETIVRPASINHRLPKPPATTICNLAHENNSVLFDVRLPVDDERRLRAAPSGGSDPDRLESLKTYGLACIPYDVPPAWRAKVIADLERFPSPIQFPTHVSQFEMNKIVSARVIELLARYGEMQARENAQKEADLGAGIRLGVLKAHGTSYSIQETSEWDWVAQSEAWLEVGRDLDAKVRADWSERDVEKLVD